MNESMMTGKLKISTFIGTMLFFGSIPFAIDPHLLPFSHTIALLVSWGLFTLGIGTLLTVIWHFQPTLPEYKPSKKSSKVKKLVAGFGIILLISSIPFLFMPSSLPISSSVKINTFVVWSTFIISVAICFAAIWQFVSQDAEEAYKQEEKRRQKMQEQANTRNTLKELEQQTHTVSSPNAPPKDEDLQELTPLEEHKLSMQYPKDVGAAKGLTLKLNTYEHFSNTLGKKVKEKKDKIKKYEQALEEYNKTLKTKSDSEDCSTVLQAKNQLQALLEIDRLIPGLMTPQVTKEIGQQNTKMQTTLNQLLPDKTAKNSQVRKSKKLHKRQKKMIKGLLEGQKALSQKINQKVPSIVQAVQTKISQEERELAQFEQLKPLMKKRDELSRQLFALDLNESIFRLGMEIEQLQIELQELEKENKSLKPKTYQKKKNNLNKQLNETLIKMQEAKDKSSKGSPSWTKECLIKVEKLNEAKNKLQKLKTPPRLMSTTVRVISNNRFFYAPLPINNDRGLRLLASLAGYGERMPFDGMIEQSTAWTGDKSQGHDTRLFFTGGMVLKTEPKNCQYSHDRADLLNLYHYIVTDNKLNLNLNKAEAAKLFFGQVRTHLIDKHEYQQEDFNYLWPEQNLQKDLRYRPLEQKGINKTSSTTPESIIDGHLLYKDQPKELRQELYDTYSVTLFPREAIRNMLLKATPPRQQYREIAQVQLNQILTSIKNRFPSLERLTWVFPPSILPQVKPKVGYFGLDAIRLVYNSANFAIWEVVQQFCAKHSIPVEYVDLSSQLFEKPLAAKALQSLIVNKSKQQGSSKQQHSKEYTAPFIKSFAVDPSIIVLEDQRWTSRRNAYDNKKPQNIDQKTWEVRPKYISV